MRCTIRGETKLDVANKGKEWRQFQANNTTEFSVTRTTLSQLMDYWLKNYKKNSIRPKTYARYESCLRLYINPYLGTLLVSHLTPQIIQDQLNDLSTGQIKGIKGGTISSSTIRCTRRYLSEALDYAININLIKRNPSKMTKPPRLVCREISPLSTQQSVDLTHEMKKQYFLHENEPYRMVYYASYIAVLIALSTGMRLGEVFGLCWDAVDLTNNIISVKRTISTGLKEKTFAETKSSRRSIPISKKTTEELKLFQEFQECYKQSLGDKWNTHQFKPLITGVFGSILSTSNFKSRYFIPVLQKLGLQDRTFHDLRHTHATLLLQQKINPKIVQERLGHSTITITLDTYSHLVPDIQKEAVKALEHIGL